jgi:hypothetical protein
MKPYELGLDESSHMKAKKRLIVDVVTGFPPLLKGGGVLSRECLVTLTQALKYHLCVHSSTVVSFQRIQIIAACPATSIHCHLAGPRQKVG